MHTNDCTNDCTNTCPCSSTSSDQPRRTVQLLYDLEDAKRKARDAADGREQARRALEKSEGKLEEAREAVNRAYLAIENATGPGVSHL